MNRNINNIGILDIRNATSKEIKGIGEIQNVGILIYSNDTSEFLNELTIRNIGCSVKIDEDFVPITGGFRISKEYLSSIKSDVNLVIAGQLTVDKDLPANDIKEKISNIVVSGDIICPEKLLSVIQKKARIFSGAIRTFNDETRLIVGRVNISDEYLSSLDDNTILSISGIIELSKKIDLELLLKKVKRLDLCGKVILKEEYIKDFLSRIKGNVNTVVIPRGYSYIKDDIIIDRFSIRNFKEDKIFTAGNIIIKRGLSVERFVKTFKSIYCEGVVICPDESADDIYDVFDKVNKFITYKGRLVEVDGEYILTTSELKFSDENIVYLVNGILDVEKGLSIEAMKKIEAFINFGMISVYKEQFGIIQTKTVIKEGVITSKEEEDETSGTVGHLVL